MKPGEVTEKAHRLVTQDRAEEHGNMHALFARIAQRWETHLGIPVSAWDVAIMMADLKLARAEQNPKGEDNYVDLAGYADIAGVLKNA